LHGGEPEFRARIDDAMIGQPIFLYHNQVGIIAVGQGGMIFDGHYVGNSDYEERCIMLENFIHCVDLQTGAFINPISPSDIKQFGHDGFIGAKRSLDDTIAAAIRAECIARGFA
jgi:hypothetical protein